MKPSVVLRETREDTQSCFEAFQQYMEDVQGYGNFWEVFLAGWCDAFDRAIAIAEQEEYDRAIAIAEEEEAER